MKNKDNKALFQGLMSDAPTISQSIDSIDNNAIDKTTSERVKYCSMMNKNTLDKLRTISAIENVPLTELMDVIAEMAVSKYEQTHGEIIKQNKKTASSLFKL